MLEEERLDQMEAEEREREEDDTSIKVIGSQIDGTWRLIVMLNVGIVGIQGSKG